MSDRRAGLGGAPSVAPSRADADPDDRTEGDLSDHGATGGVAGDRPAAYERAPKGAIVDTVEPKIRELPEAWPDMPATVVAERTGRQRGMTILRDRVRGLRLDHPPAMRPRGPAMSPAIWCSATWGSRLRSRCPLQLACSAICLRRRATARTQRDRLGTGTWIRRRPDDPWMASVGSPSPGSRASAATMAGGGLGTAARGSFSRCSA